MPKLPSEFRYVSVYLLKKIVGTYAASLLCKHFGGRESIYIPTSKTSESPIKNIIGDLHFYRLVAAAGGMLIDLPKGIAPKKAAIMDAIQSSGLATGKIAARFGVTERYVRMVRSELRRIGVECPVQGASQEHTQNGRPGTRKRAIANAYSDGLRSIDEIARKTGASAGYVSDILKGMARPEADNG